MCIKIVCKGKVLKIINNCFLRFFLISFDWWFKNSIKGVWFFIVKVKYYKYLSF